jgi:hypothetical protein
VGIHEDDVRHGNGPLSFLQGAQGGNGHTAGTDNVNAPDPRQLLADLGAWSGLQPKDFPFGGNPNMPKKDGVGGLPDPHGSKVEGGLAFDDPHGPQTIDKIFKPHG